ncbi:MAG: SnoaL-like domain protein [Frankiales bacterium]|jgi:ketosteroid isomerase-like protein|nr:SnoaL-like domain protein [Frankiales bacterium]
MIEDVIADWHRFMRGELPDALDRLLAEDVVFYSPIVFTPQRGKAITTMYLQAAGQTLPGDGGAGSFRYTKEVLAGNTAVLEFETSVEGKYVNGVDIITCNGEGLIVEFRVMIRPLQAINLVHEQMRRQLESMQVQP